MLVVNAAIYQKLRHDKALASLSAPALTPGSPLCLILQTTFFFKGQKKEQIFRGQEGKIVAITANVSHLGFQHLTFGYF